MIRTTSELLLSLPTDGEYSVSLRKQRFFSPRSSVCLRCSTISIFGVRENFPFYYEVKAFVHRASTSFRVKSETEMDSLKMQMLENPTIFNS